MVNLMPNKERRPEPAEVEQADIETSPNFEVPEAQPEVPAQPETQTQEVSEAPSKAPIAQVQETPVAPPKPADVLATEQILSNDLGDLYLSMNETDRHTFKTRGEEVTLAINQMAREGKLKVNKVLKLIHAWLKLIPGVNKFFLEQESKIKTDSVIEFYRSEAKSNDPNQI